MAQTAIINVPAGAQYTEGNLIDITTQVISVKHLTINESAGNKNNFLGASSAPNFSTGDNNIVIGTSGALDLATGYGNIFIGNRTGELITQGTNNIVIGLGAGKRMGFLNAGTVDNSLIISNDLLRDPVSVPDFLYADMQTPENGGYVHLNSTFYVITTSGTPIFKVDPAFNRVEISDAEFMVQNGAGTAGQVLTSQGPGTPTIWANAASGTPAGSNTNIQFNSSGSFGGSDNLTWNDSQSILSIKPTTAFFKSKILGGGLVGVVDSCAFEVFARDSQTTDQPGAELILSGGKGLGTGGGGSVRVRGGDTGTGNFPSPGFVEISGGSSNSTGASGGDVILIGGYCPNGTSGRIGFYTGNSVARFAINPDGSWDVGAFGASSGTSGQVLTSNGTGVPPTWQNVPSSVGGLDKQIQYNNSGVIAGTGGMWWDDPAGALRLGYEGDTGITGIIYGPEIPPSGNGAATSGIWISGSAPCTSAPPTGSSGGHVRIRGGEPKFSGTYASGSFGGDVDIRAGIGGAGGTGGNVNIYAAGTSTGTGVAGVITLATSLTQWGTNGFTINARGAWGVGAGATPSYGIAGQYFKSNGSSAAAAWGPLQIIADTNPQLGGDLFVGTRSLNSSTEMTFRSDAPRFVFLDRGGYGNPVQISTGSSVTEFINSQSIFRFINSATPSNSITLSAPASMRLSSGDANFTFVDGTGYGSGVSLRSQHKVTIVSETNNVDIVTSTGVTNLTTSSANGARVQFFEGSNGPNYVGLTAPASIVSDRTWTLPQDNPVTAAGKFLTTDSSGTLSFASAFDNGNFSTDGSITGTINAGTTVINNFAIATYRSAKYIIQATQGTEYQISEVFVIHNGTTANMTEVGTTFTGAGAIITFSVGVASGNLELSGTVTGTTSLKIERKIITL